MYPKRDPNFDNYPGSCANELSAKLPESGGPWHKGGDFHDLGKGLHTAIKSQQ